MCISLQNHAQKTCLWSTFSTSDIRDTSVLQRNVRHKLCEPDGMNVFAVLVSVSRTYHKQGIFPRTVEELIRNPDEHIQAAKQ